MTKVLGLLALYAVISEAMVVAISGPQGGWPIGLDGRVVVATLLGRSLGGAVLFFLVGAIGAGLVAFATRKTPAPLPGLKTGTTLTLTMAGLTLITQLGQQSLGLR